jgi:hypothetical protein
MLPTTAPSLAPILAGTLAFLALGAPAHAEFQLFGKTKTQFHAVGPAGFSLDGASSELSLTDDGTNLVFTLPNASIETGISLRDNHMQGYVGAEANPNLILTIPRANFQIPAEGAKATSGEAEATFNLKGKDEAVTVAYSISRLKQGMQVKASFEFDILAHDIDVPSYLGQGVEPGMRAMTKFRLAGE